MPRPPQPGRPLLTGWLLLLLREGEGHGYDLLRRLADRRVRVDGAVVYRALRRLEDDGYVESGWTDSSLGPRRRLYRLTPAGRTLLGESVERIASLREQCDMFLRRHAP